MYILRGQKGDNCPSVVLIAGTTDFMEVGVKQLLESVSIAANTRVMEFDFKGLEVIQ
jgi:hypothetical protein